MDDPQPEVVYGPGPLDAPLDFDLGEDVTELIFNEMHVMQKINMMRVSSMFYRIGKRQLKHQQKVISTGRELCCLDDAPGHSASWKDIIRGFRGSISLEFWEGLFSLCPKLAVIHISCNVGEMSDIFDLICTRYGSSLECFSYKDSAATHHRFRSPQCVFKPALAGRLTAIQHINCDSLKSDVLSEIMKSSKFLEGIVVGWIQGDHSVLRNLPKGFKILKESQWTNVLFLNNLGLEAILKSPGAETIQELSAYLEGQEIFPTDISEFQLPELRSLKLSGRLPSGGPEFIRCLASSSKVEVLDLHRFRGVETVLSDTYQLLFQGCPNLVFLKIHGDFLSDTFFTALSEGCPNMTTLSVVSRAHDDVYLSDTTLQALKHLEKMEHLHLQETGRFTGNAVKELLLSLPELFSIHLCSSDIMITGDVIDIIREREQEGTATNRRFIVHLKEYIDHRNYRIFKVGGFGSITLM